MNKEVKKAVKDTIKRIEEVLKKDSNKIKSIAMFYELDGKNNSTHTFIGGIYYKVKGLIEHELSQIEEKELMKRVVSYIKGMQEKNESK